MGLDSKKDVHLDGSTTGAVSRLEVLEGHRGAAYVRKLRELGSSPRVCYPVPRCPRWRASTERRAGKSTIGGGGFDSEACCRRARYRSRHSRR
jgi:hypothetical protein